ncbi:MAG: RNA polymerase subunit sigma-24 [Planctomycetota bacterium]|nr:MAG: RNA polymerase subunit sigma-24 [Planctomycetota bacterium]
MQALATQMPTRLENSREFSPDQDLLPLVAQGNCQAVEACLQRYRGLIWNLAKAFLRQHGDVEDATQDIFIEVWKSAHRYDSRRGRESTFIATIARRRLIDRQRRRQHRSPWLSLVGEEEAPANPDPQTAWTVELGEEVERASQALQSLQKAQRQVIKLAILEGRRQTEVADQLNLPLGTVKTHLRRGLKALRRLLETPTLTPAGSCPS